jgi:hypothetical protein
MARWDVFRKHPNCNQAPRKSTTLADSRGSSPFRSIVVQRLSSFADWPNNPLRDGEARGGGAIGAGASDWAVSSLDRTHLERRYTAGKIAQVQVHDELMQWCRPDIASATNVWSLSPEQPGRVYPYAVEMAALLQQMNDFPLYVPDSVREDGVVRIDRL